MGNVKEEGAGAQGGGSEDCISGEATDLLWEETGDDREFRESGENDRTGRCFLGERDLARGVG